MKTQKELFEELKLTEIDPWALSMPSTPYELLRQRKGESSKDAIARRKEWQAAQRAAIVWNRVGIVTVPLMIVLMITGGIMAIPGWNDPTFPYAANFGLTMILAIVGLFVLGVLGLCVAWVIEWIANP